MTRQFSWNSLSELVKEKQKEDRSKNVKRLAIGGLLAGIVGFVAGILSAPQSGKQTREDIADKTEELAASGVEQLQELNDELKNLIKLAKSTTISLSSQAREGFNEAVIKARDASDKAGHIIKAVKSGQADSPELNKALKQAKAAKKNLGKYLKS